MDNALVEDMTRGYLEAALWSSTDGDEPMDKNHDLGDIEPLCHERARRDCARFFRENALDLAVFMETTNRGWECIGHDFWLTRNGHGTGFWDRNGGDAGDRLTDAARAFGEVSLYVADDGRIVDC